MEKKKVGYKIFHIARQLLPAHLQDHDEFPLSSRVSEIEFSSGTHTHVTMLILNNFPHLYIYISFLYLTFYGFIVRIIPI